MQVAREGRAAEALSRFSSSAEQAQSAIAVSAPVSVTVETSRIGV
jgi:hypothetical protein